ncbi:MAG: hypothetical protein JW717_08115 [Marinilabiliaceae bacterium]|nr:hypothetical protein [Marinilabiliaceae bacterium]
MKKNFSILIVSIFSLCFYFSTSAQINTDRVIANARNAIFNEDYALGIQYLNKVIDAKPYLADPYFWRGYAKFKLEDYIGALKDINKSVDINPFQAEVRRFQGYIYNYIGENNKALDAFNKGLDVDKFNVLLHVGRASVYKDIEEYQKALDDYNIAIKQDSKVLGIYLERGICKVLLGDTIGALNDYSHVIDRNPLMYQGFWLRGVLHSQMKEYPKALDDYNKVIELKPEISDVYLNRGVVKYQMDDLKGSLSDLDKALELNNRNILALINRGLLKAEIGDLNNAIFDFSRVLALDPTDLQTLYNRSIVYGQLNQYQLATTDINVVIENYPEYYPAYNYRAYLKEMMNDHDGAAIDYMTYMKLRKDKEEKDNKVRQEADKLLAEKGNSEDKEKDEDTNLKKKKETRSKSDKDIKNHNKIAVLDDFEDVESKPNDILESIRGEIQNYNIFVDLESSFGLSYYSADSSIIKLSYFDNDVEKLNKKKIFNRELKFANKEIDASGNKALSIFNEINRLTVEINRNEEGYYDYLFVRAALYATVMNFNSALNDLNVILEHQPDNKLALLNRAFVRLKIVELIQSVEDNEMSNNLTITHNITNKSDANISNEDITKKIIDYELILEDLNKIIAVYPDFAFAYFNRGIIKCIKKDFEGGVGDFSKAIEVKKNFNEAFFNRGITLIYLNKTEEGTYDLSKAGELGNFKAYNVIKRFGNIKKE